MGGEAKIREEAAKQGQALEAQAMASGQKVALSLHQAIVLQACQRIQQQVIMECGQLSELNQREAAQELAGVTEYVQKFASRYLRETQNKIIIPKLSIDG